MKNTLDKYKGSFKQYLVGFYGVNGQVTFSKGGTSTTVNISEAKPYRTPGLAKSAAKNGTTGLPSNKKKIYQVQVTITSIEQVLVP